jgi:outer membrane receptor protein involved in Fe transport
MNTMKANKFALLCAASVVALTAAAHAQQQQQEVESVTVTGSRVISQIENSPTPLTVVTVEQLQLTTPTNIPDALNKLPDFLGGSTPRSQGNGSTNNGGNTLNLRNLGASRTLILMDGKRVAPSNQNGTVNIDALPQMLVSRVDVVTGGASAVYGSDAVAGVVNFVLDKSFTGFKYDINAGISDYGDAAEQKIGIAWGTSLFNGRGHFEMAMRAFNQDMIPIAARPYGYQNQTWVEAGTGSAAAPFVDVPYGRLFNQSLTGTIKCGNGCTLNDYTFTAGGGLVPLTHGIPTTIAGLESGGGGGYAAPIDTTMQSRQRQAEFFGRFSYDLTPNVNFYAQAGWSESYDFSRWTPLLVSSASSRPNAFFTNNPYLPTATQAALTAAATAAGNFVRTPPTPYTQLVGNITSVGPTVAPNTPFFTDAHYVNIIDGKPASKGDNIYTTRGLNRNLSFTTGLSAIFAGFSWDGFYSHQESRVTVSNPQNTNNARFMAAQDAVIAPAGTRVPVLGATDGRTQDVSGTIQCWVTTQAQFAPLYPGCVPMNLFSLDGPSQESFDYIKSKTFWTLTQKLDNVGGSVAGGLFGLGLPAGEVMVAASAEMRWRTYDMQSNALPTDFVNCTGLRMCTQNGNAAPALWTQNVNAPISAADDVWEVALEFNVPLLKDFPLAQEMAIDIAGRHTSYSISGDTQTWKIGLNNKINDSIRLRGTMSMDIRAPNLNDLFQPLGISSTGFADLLTSANNSTQLVTRGNATLTPEIAKTYTLGLVLTPDFIPGLTTSLDYYQTHMTNAITNISYQNTTVQNLCIGSAPSYNSPFCSLAIRPIAPGQPGYTSTANYPTQILSSPLNSARVEMEGWNFEVDYNFEMADVWSDLPGSVTLRHLVNYTPVLQTQNLPGTNFNWAVQPKTRMTTFIGYQVGDWGFNVQNRWLSGAKKMTGPTTATAQNYVRPRISSYNITDLTIDRRFDLWGGSASAYLNVQNVFDTRAPLRGQNPSVPGLFYPGAGIYSDVGRYWTIGIRGNL